ncbi:MAG: chromosome partitioning protein ParB [Actinomycetota bacterium]
MSTGFPDADARDDFNRVQRQGRLDRMRDRARRRPPEAGDMLVFEDVTRALGRVGQRDLGHQTVDITTIVGTVDRAKGFDRQFRPTNLHTRQRWERLAAASRRGVALPAVDLYRVGLLHFVRDGHHRVSVARALGQNTIDAVVTEVLTAEAPPAQASPADLPLIDHRRVFRERVPLPPTALARIELHDGWDYALLAEGVEAWGYRRSLEDGGLVGRTELARRWFEEEYEPVVTTLRAAGLVGRRTETEAYLRLGAERFRLLRTHAWTDEVIERLRRLPPGSRR